MRSRSSGFAALAASAGLVLILCLSCSAPERGEKGDAEVVHLSEAAQEAFRAGRVERAAVLYSETRNRACLLDDAAALADAAYNLAACLLVLGEADSARSCLAEALDELKRINGSPADALLLDAEAARLQGKTGEADRICLEVLSLPGKWAADSRRLQAILLRARLACEEGRIEEARARLGEAERLISDVRLPRLHAEAARLQGELFRLSGSWQKAGASFDREAGHHKQAKVFREMAEALVRAGECYKNGDEMDIAVDRLYRAARSLYPQDLRESALAAVRLAAQAASESADTGSIRRCRDLLREIEEAKIEK